MKTLVKPIKIKLISCFLAATLAASNVNAHPNKEDQYIVPDYNEYGLDRLVDLTSDFVSDITYIPSTLGCVALDITITIPLVIVCGGAVKIPTFSEKDERKREAIYKQRDERDNYKRIGYQYQHNYPSQHETQEVDDFELVNECDTILCSKISCDRFLGTHRTDDSAHNTSDIVIQKQILDILVDNEQLPTIKRRECYNDKNDNHLIYTIWNKDKFKNKFGTGGLDVIIDKRMDKDKTMQLFLTSFMWFANNTKDTNSDKNENNTGIIKSFLVNGYKTNYKLFKFPAIATKDNYNELQDKYLNKLRAVYLPQIDGISDSKYDEVAQLQSGFAKIMTQCIKDNPNNKDKCQETAKGISNWLLYSKAGLFSSKSINNDMELNLPELKEMGTLRDKIQEQQGYLTSTNTTTATNLSTWVNQELYKTVLLYEFAPTEDYNSYSDKYCTSYSTQDLKCPIPPEIKQLDINGKDILYNVSLPLGDSAYNLFSYVPDDSYKLVFTGASSESSLNEYKEEMKELILKADKSIEIALSTLPRKNTPTYKELVETFAELSKRLIKEQKEVNVRIIYGREYEGYQMSLTYIQDFINDAKFSVSKAFMDVHRKNLIGKNIEIPDDYQIVYGYHEEVKREIYVNKDDYYEPLKKYEYFNLAEFNKLPKRVRIKDILDSMNIPDTTLNNSVNQAQNVIFPLKIQLTPYKNYLGDSAYTDYSLSLNQAKLIVVDGKYTNIGSTNLYENYDDGDNRIKNVSVTFNENPQLASLMHKFMYNLATRYNFNPNITNMSYKKTAFYQKNEVIENVPNYGIKNFINYSVAPITPTKDPVNMIVVPQYGHIKENSEIRNISEIAQVALLKAAKQSVFISQSGIFPKHSEPMIAKTLNNSKFNDQMLEAIREKVKAGIKVTIVKSSDKSVTADDGSYDVLSAAAIKRILLLDDMEHPNHSLLEVVEAKNSNGEYVHNHATMIIVDNKAAYVGSHPMYNASHAEYGFIIQDEKFTKKLYDGYIKTLEKS